MREDSTTYEQKPWLQVYPPDIPTKIEIPEISVAEAFDKATEKWKDRTAFIFYGGKISFGELREKADRLANALFHLGVRKGDRIALLLLNSPEFVIACYGAIKTGAVITPVSPVYVSSEVKYQLKDSGAEHIICQDILYDMVEKTGAELRNVILTNISESLPAVKRLVGKSVLRGIYDKMAVPSRAIFDREGHYQLQELLKRYPPKPPNVQIYPREDLVTLPYTGGTTGPPKGVMINHRNIIADDIQYYGMYPFLEDGKEVGIAYMPFYHAAGFFTTVIASVLRGWKQIIFTTPAIDEIVNGMVSHGVTQFLGAPTMYELLKDHERRDDVNWKKLKLIVSGADALHESTAREWTARTGTIICDNYGQTEFVAGSHANPRNKQRPGTIGIPIINTMAAILDPEEDRFVPVGELGEIAVIGEQVTRGYWNNPAATKECQAAIDGKVWWRTGDLGSMSEDGYFSVYDRKRDLIKYKGLRVYAREVEEVLKTHPCIKEIGVVGVEDMKVGANVKAYVVLERDARGKLSEEEIAEYCRDKLAHYKIPKIIEFVGEIPKTDVGKVSRRELRETKDI